MERGMAGERRGREERRVFVSYFTVVIKHLIKTTYRRKGLFGLIVPGG